eukprot:764352-Hanusia_phi.AAC.2
MAAIATKTSKEEGRNGYAAMERRKEQTADGRKTGGRDRRIRERQEQAGEEGEVEERREVRWRRRGGRLVSAMSHLSKGSSGSFSDAIAPLRLTLHYPYPQSNFETNNIPPSLHHSIPAFTPHLHVLKWGTITTPTPGNTHPLGQETEDKFYSRNYPLQI